MCLDLWYGSLEEIPHMSANLNFIQLWVHNQVDLYMLNVKGAALWNLCNIPILTRAFDMKKSLKSELERIVFFSFKLKPMLWALNEALFLG